MGDPQECRLFPIHLFEILLVLHSPENKRLMFDEMQQIFETIQSWVDFRK